MPYRSNDDLPPSVRDHLPSRAQTIYREAFNHAWIQYAAEGREREAICHRVAWAAVKRQFEKMGRMWVPR
jgi:cation transport regulator